MMTARNALLSCIVLQDRAGLMNKRPCSLSPRMPWLDGRYNGIPLNIYLDDYDIGAVGSAMTT